LQAAYSYTSSLYGGGMVDIKQVPKIVRIVALVVGLAVLGVFWLFVTTVPLVILSVVFSGGRSEWSPSVVYIICVVLSYIYVLALFFGQIFKQK
jgi:hypothetical protein